MAWRWRCIRTGAAAQTGQQTGQGFQPVQAHAAGVGGQEQPAARLAAEAIDQFFGLGAEIGLLVQQPGAVAGHAHVLQRAPQTELVDTFGLLRQHLGLAPAQQDGRQRRADAVEIAVPDDAARIVALLMFLQEAPGRAQAVLVDKLDDGDELFPPVLQRRTGRHERKLDVLAGAQVVGGVVQAGTQVVPRRRATDRHAIAPARVRVEDAVVREDRRRLVPRQVDQLEGLVARELPAQRALPVRRRHLGRFALARQARLGGGLAGGGVPGPAGLGGLGCLRVACDHVVISWTALQMS